MILLSRENENDHLQNINTNILVNNNLRSYSITICLCITINYCIFHGYIKGYDSSIATTISVVIELRAWSYRHIPVAFTTTALITGLILLQS